MASRKESTTQADFVVIGFGAAGAAAAIEASRAGASVIVLEKQDEAAHYPSAEMSGGLIMGVNDPRTASAYLDACAGGMIPPDVSEALANRAVTLTDWLLSVGLPTTRIAGAWHPTLAGFGGIDVLAPSAALDPTLSADAINNAAAAGVLPRSGKGPSGGGRHFFQALRATVNRCDNVEVCFGQPADRLIRDAKSGRVVAVETLTGDGSRVRVEAHKGVVLASGGFEYNEGLKRDYLKAYPIHFYGSSANTGDGIMMAMEAGADLWHMNQMVGRAVLHFEDDDGRPLNFPARLDPPGYVITDRYGERFANEHLQATSKPHFYYELLAFDASELEYRRIPSYWFFDSRRMEAGPLVLAEAGIVGAGFYDWSTDNSREVEAGWIKAADSIGELAELAGVLRPDQAAATIAAYNQHCADLSAGDPFGRPPESMLPLDSPPYYCVQLFPGGANTSGGPRRDARGRILDTRGHPIPGLYGAGELGQAFGMLYPSAGANLADAICFAQLAIETAVGEQDASKPT